MIQEPTTPSSDSIPKTIPSRAVPGGAGLEWLTGFTPRRGLRNGHLQTIVGNFLPRPPFRLISQTDTVEVDPTDASRVLCHCNWHSDPSAEGRLTVLLVHGLEGSSDSRYIQALAARAWDAGCNVVRMNMRNCGTSDALTPTLYHSGLSGDVAAVVEHYTRRFALQRWALVGYSMGGNLVLKMAGEWGARPPLHSVAAVCPAIDLAAGSDALHEPANRMYEWHFLRRLMRRFRIKASLYPEIYTMGSIGAVRSLREFDDKIVAPFCGFRNADDYYHRAASARVIDRIAVPTLILLALDDPFIRLTDETRAKIIANPNIHFIETSHGGHCAYLGMERGNDIHWAESMIIRYLLHQSGISNGM